MSGALRCPSCGHVTDAITDLFGNELTPAAGDVTVCFECLEPHLATGAGLETRKPTAAEREQLLADYPTISRVIALLRDFKAGAARSADGG